MNKKNFVIIAIMAISFNLLLIFGCAENTKNNVEKTINNSDTIIGNAICKKCHKKIDTLIVSGSHKNLNCETCHGSGSMHRSSPMANKMILPIKRTDCALCHSGKSSKSKDAKQIDTITHFPNNRCIKCHDPHNTGFGRLANSTPNSSTCSICHSKVNAVRLGSSHRTVECQSCHLGWEKHLVNPKKVKPTKTTTREFCGQCHGQGIASATTKIKLIDLKEHMPDMKCIECHKAHCPVE